MMKAFKFAWVVLMITGLGVSCAPKDEPLEGSRNRRNNSGQNGGNRDQQPLVEASAELQNKSMDLVRLSLMQIQTSAELLERGLERKTRVRIGGDNQPVPDESTPCLSTTYKVRLARAESLLVRLADCQESAGPLEVKTKGQYEINAYYDLDVDGDASLPSYPELLDISTGDLEILAVYQKGRGDSRDKADLDQVMTMRATRVAMTTESVIYTVDMNSKGRLYHNFQPYSENAELGFQLSDLRVELDLVSGRILSISTGKAELEFDSKRDMRGRDSLRKQLRSRLALTWTQPLFVQNGCLQGELQSLYAQGPRKAEVVVHEGQSIAVSANGIRIPTASAELSWPDCQSALSAPATFESIFFK